jgi:hypothetical protein
MKKHFFKIVMPVAVVVLTLSILPHLSFADKAAYYDCLQQGGTPDECAAAESADSSGSSAGSSGGTVVPAATNVPGTYGTGTNVPATQPAGSQAPASASNSNSAPVTTLTNPLKGVNSISDLILTFMKIVSYMAVILGVIMLMWVGLQFVMARGNPEEIKKRSNQLLWIVIGIGVILGSTLLVNLVINTLQATGTVNPAVIQSAQNAANNR